LESIVVELAVVVADSGGVDRDQAHVVVVDHVLDRAFSREIRMRGPKRVEEWPALVVIPGYQ
jgi:hypothetical protein